MLVRIVAILGVMTLSASAQTQERAPTSGALCERIASAAFAANRELSTTGTAEAGSAPYVKQLQSAPQITDIEWVERELTYAANPADIYEPYARWGSLVGLLPHEGKMLEIMAAHDFGYVSRVGASGAFLKSALTREGLFCAFDNRLHERYRASAQESEGSCGSLLSDDSVIVEATAAVPAGLGRETFWKQRELTPNEHEYPYNGSGSYSPEGVVDIDVDGDGVAEKLVRVVWSGPGDRCSSTYYDLLDSEDPTKLSSAPLRQLVRGAQAVAGNPTVGGRCGRETRLRKAGNRVLFELSGFEPVAKRGEPLIIKYAGPLERTLRDISGDAVRTLCTTTFSIEPIVVFAR